MYLHKMIYNAIFTFCVFKVMTLGLLVSFYQFYAPTTFMQLMSRMWLKNMKKLRDHLFAEYLFWSK